MTEKQIQFTMNALVTSGLFVTCGLEHPNIMSTHWGSIGRFWNRQIFILPIRQSKLSHEMISSDGFFTVSVPMKDLSTEIMLCDHLSGRGHNKFEELNLHAQRAKSVDTYVIADCGLHIECKVLDSCEMDTLRILPELKNEQYEGKDFHTFFFAEIINCYEQSGSIGNNNSDI